MACRRLHRYRGRAGYASALPRMRRSKSARAAVGFNRAAGVDAGTVKTVSVLLTQAWLDCLKANADGGSIAAVCLERAVDVQSVLTGTALAYNVTGTERELRAVLELASRHCCSEAVAGIKDYIKRFTG